MVTDGNVPLHKEFIDDTASADCSPATILEENQIWPLDLAAPARYPFRTLGFVAACSLTAKVPTRGTVLTPSVACKPKLAYAADTKCSFGLRFFSARLRRLAGLTIPNKTKACHE